MRVLTGSLVQESNTFSPLRSGLDFFRAGCLLFDGESLEAMAERRAELSGFIAASRRAGVELVPTLAAWASSGGPFDARDFQSLTEEFLRRVETAGPVDGVLLALRGAWVAEDHDDADGWLLERVRRIVGPHIPIVVSLDLHANVTKRMVSNVNGLVGYRTYPHIDMFETGERAADLLFTLIRDGLHPAVGICKVPMVVPPENAQTTDGPAGDLMAEVIRLERAPHILSASLFVVQPWLDVAEMGCTVLVATDGDGALAQRRADGLGEHLWNRRHEFQVPLVPPAVAVERALSVPRGPVLLVDSADSVSSGAPGDSTAVLRALLDAPAGRPALVTVVDPEAARQAAWQDGRTITLPVGGRLDPARHRPVTVSGLARRVPDGRITFTAGIGDGLSADMGGAAVLQAGDVHILLMEKPVPCYDPALYRAASLEPRDAQVVVVKSPNNFRWTYREIADEWIYVDAPGASTPRLGTLPFRWVPRPLFPLDDMDWWPGRRG